MDLAEGESPFGEEDRIDALYVVREGWLRAVERGPSGDTLVRTIGPGELLDQLQTLAGGVRPVRIVASEPSRLAVIAGDVVDALVATHADFRHARERLHRRQLFCRLHGIFFTGEPRAGSVRAVRDSVVVGVTSEAFDSLVAKRPQMLRHITRHIVEQHRRPAIASSTSGRISTIAIVTLGSVRTPEFVARLTSRIAELGSATRLSSQDVNTRMAEPGIAQTPEESADCERLLAWLEGQETKHRFVVYEADATATEWTRRCLRQADRIVLVAHAGDDPSPGALERELLLGQGRITNAIELLVLVHPDGTRMPSGTNRWLRERPHVEDHRHVRWTEDADFGRLARMLAGRAVGVVLGGGGGARLRTHWRAARAA